MHIHIPVPVYDKGKCILFANVSGSKTHAMTDRAIIRAEGLFRCSLYMNADRVLVKNLSGDAKIIYCTKQ